MTRQRILAMIIDEFEAIGITGCVVLVVGVAGIGTLAMIALAMSIIAISSIFLGG